MYSTSCNILVPTLFSTLGELIIYVGSNLGSLDFIRLPLRREHLLLGNLLNAFPTSRPLRRIEAAELFSSRRSTTAVRVSSLPPVDGEVPVCCTLDAVGFLIIFSFGQ